jgi:hypothetical protein
MILERRPDIPEYVARRVSEILEAEQVGRLLPPTPDRRIRIEAMVPAGLPVAAAHGNWRSSRFPKVPGLPPLACQAPDRVTPHGVVRVVCECVVAPSGGMSSYYGFEGWFVSLLVCIPEGCVWDARVEEAR